MKFRHTLLSVMLVFAVSAYVQADDINYGDFVGDTVTYIDVTESSLEELPLYGTPEVFFPNNLSMPGTGFVTESNNGGINFLDGRLTFMIEAAPGFEINSITLREFGAYFTFGEESIASINGIAFVETLEGDVFSGTLDFTANGSSQPDGADWLEELTITFPNTTKITITIDNQLFSFADNPGVAFIDKKGIDIIVGKRSVIPEPTSAALLAIGLIGIVSRSRRRS